MTPKDKAAGGGNQLRPPPEEVAKCPRCDSTNTKFCYYNNYSPTQPRHFCKACRRYWTKGGALRNVPIGGGCRKNNKRPNKSISKLSSHDFKDPNASSHFGGLKFSHGFSPAMEFQPGSIGGGGELPFSSFQSYATASVYNSNLASSIEYLSYVNQDMHRKLQQQRSASLFGKERNKDGDGGEVSTLPVTAVFENEKLQAQKPLQPISFQDSTNTKGCMSGGSMTTEWFFGNSYPATATTATTTSAANQSGSNENENTSNWNGFQAWTDPHQYNLFP